MGLGSVGCDILAFLVTELVLDLGSTLPDMLLPEFGDLNHFEGFDSKPESPEGEEERGKLKRPVAGLWGGWSGKFREPWDCWERLEGMTVRGEEKGWVDVWGMNDDLLAGGGMLGCQWSGPAGHQPEIRFGSRPSG